VRRKSILFKFIDKFLQCALKSRFNFFGTYLGNDPLINKRGRDKSLGLDLVYECFSKMCSKIMLVSC